jgi:hypothetical protein
MLKAKEKIALKMMAKKAIVIKAAEGGMLETC